MYELHSASFSQTFRIRDRICQNCPGTQRDQNEDHARISNIFGFEGEESKEKTMNLEPCSMWSRYDEHVDFLVSILNAYQNGKEIILPDFCESCHFGGVCATEKFLCKEHTSRKVEMNVHAKKRI